MRLLRNFHRTIWCMCINTSFSVHVVWWTTLFSTLPIETAPIDEMFETKTGPSVVELVVFYKLWRPMRVCKSYTFSLWSQRWKYPLLYAAIKNKVNMGKLVRAKHCNTFCFLTQNTFLVEQPYDLWHDICLLTMYTFGLSYWDNIHHKTRVVIRDVTTLQHISRICKFVTKLLCKSLLAVVCRVARRAYCEPNGHVHPRCGYTRDTSRVQCINPKINTKITMHYKHWFASSKNLWIIF